MTSKLGDHRRSDPSDRTRQRVHPLDVLVVIVSYKSASLAVQAIRSLQEDIASSDVRVRLVVVDNASGDYDDIADAVERNGWSSWVTLVKTPRNGGFAYGNNVGIRTAYAVAVPDYIYLLNPDAEVRPGAVGVLARFLEENPRAGIAGSRIVNSNGSDWSIAFRFPGMLSELDGGLETGLVTSILRRYAVARKMGGVPQQVDWVCGASMMIRPEVVARIGGFDENYFLYFEETDFCFRAKREGFETWYVAESQVMHIRGQSTSVTDLNLGPKRLPTYWFESRRRFFLITYGLSRAIAIDVVALVACSLGLLKRKILNSAKSGTPHFIRDLLRNSALLPRNWSVPPVQTFVPDGPVTHREVGS